MDDFETNPAGAADLVARLRDYEEYEQSRDGQIICVKSDMAQEAADCIEQLEAALTRANAATAAAYEMAARLFDDGNSVTGAAIGRCVRALATPDQTAALDKLIAEAVDAALKQAAFWVEEAMVIVAPDGVPQRMALDSYRKQFSTLVLASKKGGV